jgi:hypothetical protein
VPRTVWDVGLVSSIDIAGHPEIAVVRIKYGDRADLMIDVYKGADGEWRATVQDLAQVPIAS